jgi:GST-like protein
VLIDRAPAAGGDAVLSESAAFLVYLAEKAERLLPIEARLPGKVFEQLFFHASGLSPAFLQASFYSEGGERACQGSGAEGG